MDRFGRVVDQNWINASTSAAIDRTQYGYDRDGNVLYERNLSSGTNSVSFSTLYTYDDLNRLSTYDRGTLSSDGSSITTPSSMTDHSKSWELDSQGNWTSQTTDSGSAELRSSDHQNELTSVGGTSLTYDNNGNTLTDGQGNTYVYDAWNRIKEVTNSTYGEEFYLYLPGTDQAQEFAFGTGPTVTLYYSDSGQVLEELGISGSHMIQNVWGLGYVNDLVLRDQDTDSSKSTGNYGKIPGSGTNTTGLDQRLYAIRDANHDVTAITDASGNAQERFSYDPYGNVTTLSSTWTSTSDSYSWLYLYQGGRRDVVSGTYKFGDRIYSTTLGRWLQQDSAGYIDGSNPYKFEQSNPNSAVDPTGEVSEGDNHFYPLHLGGSNNQPVGWMSYLEHIKYHDYLKRNNLWFGDPGRQMWAGMGDIERINHILNAANEAGLSEAQMEAIVENMPQIMAGANPGAKTVRLAKGSPMWPGPKMRVIVGILSLIELIERYTVGTCARAKQAHTTWRNQLKEDVHEDINEYHTKPMIMPGVPNQLYHEPRPGEYGSQQTA